MGEYRGFIALVPRREAESWIRRCTTSSAAPVLQGFASDVAWRDDQTIPPTFGHELVLKANGRTYAVWQYTTYSDDVLAVACGYTQEWIGPATHNKRITVRYIKSLVTHGEKL